MTREIIDNRNLQFNILFRFYIYIKSLFGVETYFYFDDKIELLRKVVKRGGRGIDGKQPLKYVLLKDVNNKWLAKMIHYEKSNRPDNSFLDIYIAELAYRIKNKIIVK